MNKLWEQEGLELQGLTRCGSEAALCAGRGELLGSVWFWSLGLCFLSPSLLPIPGRAPSSRWGLSHWALVAAGVSALFSRHRVGFPLSLAACYGRGNYNPCSCHLQHLSSVVVVSFTPVFHCGVTALQLGCCTEGLHPNPSLGFGEGFGLPSIPNSSSSLAISKCRFVTAQHKLTVDP